MFICCVKFIHGVRRVVSFVLLSLLPKAKKREFYFYILPVVHRCVVMVRGCYIWYQSGFDLGLGITTNYVDLIFDYNVANCRSTPTSTSST
jgi:hypothetical protein